MSIASHSASLSTNMESLTMDRSCSLKGHVALITGGGQGIGLMIAKGFVANGARVYITGRRMEVLEQAAKENGLIPLLMDVTSKDSIREAVRRLESEEGKLDILVNNAGIAGGLSMFISDHDAPEHKNLGESLFELESYTDKWMSVFSTNSIAPFFVTTGFLALLEKGALSGSRNGKTSSVINVTSAVTGLNTSSNNFAYGSSKAALEWLTKSMATEFGLSRIPVRVNGLAPGVVATGLVPMPQEYAEKALPGAFQPAPVLRFANTDDMAAAAVYLASQEFVTGTILKVDGGYTLVNP
ncbi:short-chain dehydrogenase [Dendrothele bispora CBS 962.96]|uniref:Short-chain dehydrogenase n=1 Tax=Dendrothele bispora (strain CBS 962.96) TaxID=1314807 RepID=A0A4S8LXM3_DENBC|nr:short-chain dehydrogenase [Dendrothele bispora CBS 962.96]